MSPNPNPQKQNLRKLILEQRNQLSQAQQDQSARDCSDQICQSTILKNASNIALYLPHKGELDPTPLIHALWLQSKKVFVPVVEENNSLRFVLYEKDCEVNLNRYGIAEPITTDHCSLDNLDLMFLPLVAFDENGYRLGMGGGYYDRALAKLSNKDRVKTVGLAYEFQKVEQVPTEEWDQTMDMIATEMNIYRAIT